MYANGQGVPKDYEKAVKWFRLAAEQGNADALKNLGEMYANAQGVPPDYVLSYMWLTVGKANLTVSTKMTAAQIELAQKLARHCEESNYKQCGDRLNVSAYIRADGVAEGGTYAVPVVVKRSHYFGLCRDVEQQT